MLAPKQDEQEDKYILLQLDGDVRVISSE